MKDVKNFQERYNRWKNGERYWDIRGVELPKYDTGKTSTEKKNDFYSWMDKLADKKAQDWTKAPMKPLDPTLVEMQMLNDPTYNYETFYNLQPFMAERMLQADPDAHFTDIAKTMYHPTFSDESVFSGNVSDFNPLGIIGGHWNEAGTEYTPSASQLQNYFNYDVTRNYLNRNEDHPVKINLPKYGGGKIGGFVHRMGPLIYQGLVSRGVKNINAAYANLMRQISHESGYGTSGISRQHNYGGIKIPGSNNYRKFKSDRDFTDYYLDLMTSRYRNAIDAKDLNGFVNELGSKGYFRGQTAAQYLGKLNTLKSLDRAVAQDLANRRDFYNQTTGIQQNPETNEPEFVQPIPKEQQSIEVPYLDPQKLGTLTFPVNQPIIDIRTILPKLKPMVYQYWKPDESFDHGKSGIHINPANRGKFNATKKRTDKTTKELTHSKNPLTRKRAIFALNASKWNKK